MIALILDDKKKYCNSTEKKWAQKMFTTKNFAGQFCIFFKELEDEKIYFYK